METEGYDVRRFFRTRAGRHLAATSSAVAAAIAALAISPAAASGGPGTRFANVAEIIHAAPTVTPAEWQRFRQRFIASEGRMIDHERQGITHSDAQGYGLLLAAAARDRATFDRIADFTLREMRTRADGLVSWLYNPRAFPPVIDVNNATDGDILIAKGLIKGAILWNEPRYLEEAIPIVRAIGRNLLQRRHGLIVLRPAAFGFGAQNHPDGPLVNLSYYVFGALRLFALVDDRHPWREVWESGLKLSNYASRKPGGLPPDWASLAAESYLLPARRYPRLSSYDAMRIPLHMALGGGVPKRYFRPFDKAWNIEGNGRPVELDLVRKRPLRAMEETGYRAVSSLVACVVRGVPVPQDVTQYSNSTYYASTLHLLTLSALRAYHPDCLRTEADQRAGRGTIIGLAQPAAHRAAGERAAH
jgi:endoglucanase